MRAYNFLKRPVTSNLKDPRSKAEEPDQPFRLVSPMTRTRQSLHMGEEGGRSIAGLHEIRNFISYQPRVVNTQRVVEGLGNATELSS